MNPEEYGAKGREIEAEVGKFIVGQQELIRQVLVCVLSEGHALLEGVPGLGKTMLLKTLSRAVDLEFARIQFTPDLMPADIVGTQVLSEDEHGRRHFSYSAGPLFANLILADEVNRATPKTQSALLEAMQERSVTVAGETRSLPRPFFVMATQNPIEMEGTYPLPEAQLDRFLLKVTVPFPEVSDLVGILERTTTGYEPSITKVIDAPTLSSMIHLTVQVPVASHLINYAARIVSATHPSHEGAPELIRRYVRFGSSPRGAQALILASKVTALMDGRLNVSEDDIKAIAPPALRHRLILTYEAIADEVDPDALIREVLDRVPSPQKELEELG